MNGHLCPLGNFTVWDDGSMTLPGGKMDPPGTWIYESFTHFVRRADEKFDGRIPQDACKTFTTSVSVPDDQHAAALSAAGFGPKAAAIPYVPLLEQPIPTTGSAAIPYVPLLEQPTTGSASDRSGGPLAPTFHEDGGWFTPKRAALAVLAVGLVGIGVGAGRLHR